MRKRVLFKKLIVIGYGKITGEIMKYLYKRQKEYEYSLEYIEHETETFGATGKICHELGITCCKIEDKKKLTEYFLEMTDRCLIISASNNYLFPKALTENPVYTIINFHNALLPKFPGRNAPSWAIFENEKETGITWHYVTKQIDGGDIIIQKKCEISPEIRAYELAEKLMRLAYEGFTENFDDIIENKVLVKQQKIVPERKLYLSTDCPGDCTFHMGDLPEFIYRLLRSVDYGKYGIFPPVTTVYGGKKIKIVRYARIPSDKVEEKPGKIYLPLDKGFSLRLSWVELGGDLSLEGG